MIKNMQLWTIWLFVYVGTPLAWISVLLHLKTPWRKTELGRHLLAYAAVIAAVMTFATVRYWYKQPFPAWLEVAKFGVYVSLIVIMGWRIYLQVGSVRRPWKRKHAKAS
jgi:hypothetical protein